MTVNLRIPGAIDTARLAPVFVGGKPVDALLSAIKDRAGTSGAPKPISEGRFWASYARPQASSITEVFEVSISSARVINTIQFSLARFPQTVRVQYLDPETSIWTEAVERNGFPVEVVISESVPARIAPQILQQGAPHPQHYGAGHWVRHDIDLFPIRASKFRLLLTRSQGDAPRDPYANLLDYSLGVKDLNLGFRISSLDDIPHRAVSDEYPSERKPFAQGLDVLGSPIELSVRENRPYDLLRGRMWKSGPQPVQNAVVNLYVDARDAYGEGQVVNRFFVNPLTSGVHCNLYYSNDSAADGVSFKSADTPLLAPITTPVGVVVADSDGIHFDPTHPGALSIDNSGVQWNTSRPWGIGIEHVPNFDSADGGTFILFDSGALRIKYEAGAYLVEFGGLLSASAQADFTVGNPTRLTVRFDGESLRVRSTVAEMLTPGPAGQTYPVAPMLYLGAAYNLTDQYDGIIKTFVLKTISGVDDADGFMIEARPYAVLPEYRFLDDGKTDNALVRVHPDNQSGGLGTVNPFGVEGGPANIMEHLTWTPISRSYVLHKGYLEFDPVKAKRWKFEFTALSPEPFETSVPVVHTIKTFPKKVRTVGRLSYVTQSENSLSTITVHTDLASSTNNWADAARITFLNRTFDKQAFTATEALKANDPNLASRLNKASLYFNLMPWQSGLTLLRWSQTQAHTYEEIEVEHTKRIAFFVGLSALEMYRVDYEAADDTGQYLELFHDSHFIDSSSFVRGDNRIFSAAHVFESRATSKTFASKRRVRGVQFATQQSPPVQLLTDPDFRDPDLARWDAFGSAVIESEGTFASDIGSSISVVRTTRNATWGEVEETYGTNTVSARDVTFTDAGDLVGAIAHGYSVDDVVVFSAITGTTGLVDGDPYYIIAAGFTEDAFQVSLTVGGAAVTLTTDGTGTVTHTHLGNWGVIESTDQTWYTMEHEGIFAEPDGGVVGTQIVSTSKQGRLYGAARVFADRTLEEPLYLQIVSSLGDVLAESAYVPLAGQVSEWTVEYTIGEGGAVSGRTWEEVEGVSAPFEVTFTDAGDLVGKVAHGLVADDEIVFNHIFDTTGITEGTHYFVLAAGLTSDEFQISLTIGGAAVTLTTDGNGEAVALIGNTWQDLENFGTWQDVSEESSFLSTQVYPRLVQKAETEDSWSVDNISLFDDAIIWEFSNDNGLTWWPAYDIRNNANGAMLFPDFDDTTIDTIRGRQLRWRVSAYAPNMKISALAIRPLYSERPAGMPYRDSFQGAGPNISNQDDYPAIAEDPRWRLWNKPVPESWYYEFRRWLLLDNNATASFPPPPPNDHTTDGTDPNEDVPNDDPPSTPEVLDLEFPLYVWTLGNAPEDADYPSDEMSIDDVEGILDGT